jgi:hypothetical protein
MGDPFMFEQEKIIGSAVLRASYNYISHASLFLVRFVLENKKKQKSTKSDKRQQTADCSVRPQEGPGTTKKNRAYFATFFCLFVFLGLPNTR